MNHKTFVTVSGLIFVVIALLHVARIIWAWEAAIGGLVVPMWASYVAIIVAAYLSYQAWKLMK